MCPVFITLSLFLYKTVHQENLKLLETFKLAKLNIKIAKKEDLIDSLTQGKKDSLIIKEK